MKRMYQEYNMMYCFAFSNQLIAICLCKLVDYGGRREGLAEKDIVPCITTEYH